ncbi:bacillithiol biosynthesis deacetylase BshB1 [Elysia marginata]|uniref:N-acetylglucosaminylphosphatidylinositol deacetylase n=1 Tax=Elysia marginata TaxID=1093978 RepID=A0AAV4K088_9GAST|nr:bacillithiol biosynthesis deacetylase BshB1 [Elysia marginata]
MQLDILGVGAHPDDIELGCGATIAKEVHFGKKVGILDLTRGELGTRGTPEIRLREAKNAGEVLGISLRAQLNLRDGFFINDQDSQLEVVKVLRKYRPKIVLCNAVRDRHIDHGKGAKLVSDACFLSGLRKIDTGQEVWRPKQVYHYIQWQDMIPDFVVDVSGFLETKINAILAYKSQFYDPNSKEPETPISSKNFVESVSHRARNLGRIIGVESGEGYVATRYPAVDRISDLI